MLLTPNAMSRRMRFGLYATTGLIGLFLLLPIVFIVLLSFGSSQWLVFPPPGWTLKWYGQFFSNPDWMNAAAASLKVAVLTTICAVALGLPTAFALVRGRFPGREMLYGDHRRGGVRAVPQARLHRDDVRLRRQPCDRRVAVHHHLDHQLVEAV
jgi:putative spermidine/putrescine transport system permease protein